MGAEFRVDYKRREAFRLSPEQLVRQCDPAVFDFKTTNDLPPLDEGIIGQSRAVRAMEFGLGIEHPGYNFFLTGPVGTGKTTYAEAKIRQVAKDQTPPGDWCYVYNFKHPDQPVALNLPAGKGGALAQDMDELLEDLKTEIRRAFESEEYENRRQEIAHTIEAETSRTWSSVEEEARNAGFVVQRAPTGILTAPLNKEGKPYTQEDYAALPEEEKERVTAKNRELQGKVTEALRQIRKLEREVRNRVKELERETGHYAVGYLISALKDDYADFPKVVEYLDAVQKNVVEHLDEFRSDGSEEDESVPAFLRKPQKEAPLTRYKVNLFVDNSGTKGAPVVVETNPTYYNLFGKVEYRGEFGTLRTDFTMIKPGCLHTANGGYLIVQARDLLVNPFAWSALKRVLKGSEIRVENLGDQYGMVATTSLKPEAIPFHAKIVFIGNPMLYQMLFALDEDFRKYFKLKVDFDVTMERTDEHVQKYAAFVGVFCRREGLGHFDPGAMARVVEYSSRLADEQDKLSTRFNEVTELLYEASAWAAQRGNGAVTTEDVDRAVEEKVYRSNRIEEKILELIHKGTLMVDTDGEKTGQINGLAVLQLGDYSFGKPSRITARTSMGSRGVVNIERETDMSGRIHTKGVFTLSAYLAGKYAQDKPLSLSASLAFEQMYEEVDGDSASSTELYTLLSELSGLPLDQGIAVTGSVNQKGEVQPIGGANEKVEGYYHVCKLQGLTGRQGVMLPKANVRNLMLKQEVLEAVREGRFHVFAVGHVDEGIEVLTGVPAGEQQDDATYPEGTVNYLVDRRLRQMAEDLRRFGRMPRERDVADDARGNPEGLSDKD